MNDLLSYKNGILIWKVKPNKRIEAGAQAGYVNSQGYVSFMFNGNNYLAHRVIWEMHNGIIPEGMQVDHINRDRLDNRIENLRLATHQQNCWNSSGYGKSTGVKNVEKNGSKYAVRVQRKYYGRFKSLELADLVAQEVRHKLYAEYA
jgi:hypothetical protein